METSADTNNDALVTLVATHRAMIKALIAHMDDLGPDVILAAPAVNSRDHRGSSHSTHQNRSQFTSD